MREYGNYPTIAWNHEAQAPIKAKAQVLREEPLILAMPDRLQFGICASDFACTHDSETGALYDCDPEALGRLAEVNAMPGLRVLRDAAVVASALLDIDPVNYRLVLHP